MASCKWPEASQGQGWTGFYKDLGERGAALLQRSPRFCGEMKHARGAGREQSMLWARLGGLPADRGSPRVGAALPSRFSASRRRTPSSDPFRPGSAVTRLLSPSPSAAECSLRPGGRRVFAEDPGESWPPPAAQPLLPLTMTAPPTAPLPGIHPAGNFGQGAALSWPEWAHGPRWADRFPLPESEAGVDSGQ